MIRRPLMYGALSYGAAILVAYYLGSVAALVSLSMLLCPILFGRRNSRVVYLMFVFYTVSLMNFFVCSYQMEKDSVYIGKAVEIEGIIVQAENMVTSNGPKCIRLKVDTENVNGNTEDVKSRMLIKYYYEGKINLVPGQKVSIIGKAEAPDPKRNPGCFDYSLYLKSIGITTIVKASSIEGEAKTKNSEKINFMGQLYLKKEEFLKKTTEVVGKDTSGMIRAVMFGEKSQLDENTLEEFQKNGTAHILAVSGLHIGIIYGFLCLVWPWRKGKLFFILVMSFFLCYMTLASFSPSVVRAVFMVGLHTFAKITNRRYDLSSAAFLILVLMLFKNPMGLFNVGFQMSFLAVLTLALMLPIAKRFYSGIFLASVAIQTGLLPYTAYVFNYLPLCAVIINVPIIFLTGILVPLGLCSMVCLQLGQPLFELTAELLFGVSEILKYVNSLTVIEGVTVLDVTSPNTCLLAFYYLGLPVFLSEEGRLLFLRKRKKFIAAAAVAVLAASVIFGQAVDDGFSHTDIVFVDVGQGDCIHIKSEDGMNYLIDGGGSINYNVGQKTLKPYLLKNGVRRIDGAFVTHLHTDHYQGIAELCREGMVRKLFLYEGNRVKEGQILKETGLAKEELVYLCKGQTVTLGSDAYAEVLWPQRQEQSQYMEMTEDKGDENLSSLILKVNVLEKSLMVTGDVDEECQRKLAEMWRGRLKSNILKVAHHGSKYSYSREFVNSVEPQFAVFQVGKNNFGHPNEDIMRNHMDVGAKVYRNDLQGAIGFDFCEDEMMKVVKMIEK